MVLEAILFPLRAEQKPWEMFFIGMLYFSVGMFLALWIFESSASLLTVTFTVIACIPIVNNTMKLEEAKDIKINSEKELMWEHHKALTFLMFLFLGVVVASIVWYLVLPQDTVNTVFKEQTKTISDINTPRTTGQAVADEHMTGNALLRGAQLFGYFSRILFNNIKVLAFCILFAFAYGMGSIFILTWNATVIGTAMGNFIRGRVATALAETGSTSIAHYSNVIALSVLRYAIHGVPEIMAYFYGGLAGGIISVAVVRKHFSTDKISNILVDSSELLMLSLSFLVLAALLEVFVTPLFS